MKRGFTLIELLVVIAIIAILASILFPVFAKAREKARQTQCINNQKQITTAVLMYIQDNEETLPPAKSFWSDIDVPAKVLQCSTAGKKVTNAYVGNKFLDSAALGEIQFPVDTMVVADGQHAGGSGDDYPNMAKATSDFANRHGFKCIVGYLDGHVALTMDPRPWIKVIIDPLDGTSSSMGYSLSGSSSISYSSNDTYSGCAKSMSFPFWQNWTINFQDPDYPSGDPQTGYNMGYSLLAPVHRLDVSVRADISWSNPWNQALDMGISFWDVYIPNSKPPYLYYGTLSDSAGLGRPALQQKGWHVFSIDLDAPATYGTFQGSNFVMNPQVNFGNPLRNIYCIYMYPQDNQGTVYLNDFVAETEVTSIDKLVK